VARAKDELQRAQSAYTIAHLTWQRLANVGKTQPGLVAQEEIDSAQSKALEAEAQVSAARSGLAAARQHVQEAAAEVGKTQTLMDYTRVTAPFTGVITKRYADVGSMIQAGTASETQAEPLVQLSQNDLLRLILPVPESAVPTIHVGKRVEVMVPTLHRTFPGRVTRFADTLDLATRTMRTEVDVPNPNLVLVPGMYAEVHLAVARANNALVLPDMAVDLNSNATSGKVMVITPNHRVEPRTIGVGLDTAKAIEVTSGLNEGDMVVLSGRSALRPGEKVRPRLVTLGAAAPEAG
jgi:RND family efflux transporter MFP subunit